MSTTPTATANDKFVVHSNGHLKRIDASTLTNGQYGFTVADGGLSVSEIDTEIKVTSFKDKDKKPLIPTSPFVPIAQRDGFMKLQLPNATNVVCGVLNKGSDGYICQDITGVNVIRQQYKLTPPADGSAFYYYNNTQSVWKSVAVPNGAYYIKRDTNDVQLIKVSGDNLFAENGFFATSENVMVQWNKNTLNKINVPTKAGNYNLNVDGNLTFGQGETVERLSVTYKLSAKEGKSPTLGTGIQINGSGDDNIAFDSTYKLKTNSRFYVEAKFTFQINENSVFDTMERPAKFTFALSSDSDNVVDSQYVYHPENGILELRFSGICSALDSETPNISVTPDEVFTALNINLPYADSTNLGSITFIEV